ncbi:MAG: 6,7-dimethyl-8-ribityllumazine synthase [Chitinophagales bacterium]
MSAQKKNLSQHNDLKVPYATKYKVAIAVSEYNEQITFALRDGALKTLLKYGVKEKNIQIELVPGAYELPLACKWLFEAHKADAVIALGCVIKGDTDHDIYINNAVSSALMNLSVQTQSPFVFGVITPNNYQQAKDRAGGKHGNKGVECAVAVLKMLALKDKLKK